MKYVVVDLEMNTLANKFAEEKEVCGMETIAIGAVLLDEQYCEIDAFKTLVKPQYNDVIGAYYTRLTGITTEMVKNAPVFEKAFQKFFGWLHSVDNDIQIYQWSDTDLDQVTKEINLKHIQIDTEDQPLIHNWYNLQKEYGEKLNLTKPLSLKNVVMYAGIEFIGKEHDPLCDASNTATLLRILRDPKLCDIALGHVIEALTPKSAGTTLGELFNFAEFDISA